MALVDAEGRPAAAGKSTGRWLDESDFVFSGDDHEGDVAAEISPHTFPRDWPDVYQESDALRSLLRKKGACAAKRVSVVPNPEGKHKALAEGLDLRLLQSLANAEAVQRKSGLSIVEGWAIYDLLDDVTGAAFVAERYWWNALSDGTWLDFTPRPENLQQLLLVEAMAPRPPKKATTLTRKQQVLAERLLELRFPKAHAAARAASRIAGGGGSSSSSAAPAIPAVTEELKTAVKRIKLGLIDPVHQLLARAERNPELCEGLVRAGTIAALSTQLFSRKNAPACIRLLAVLMRAAVDGGYQKKAVESLLDADGVEPLVELVASREADLAALAAQVLGHACVRSPPVQERAVRAGVMRHCVRWLARKQERVAAQAAYALWHLQVGVREHAEAAVAAGAASALLPLLAEGIPEEARMNAVGALMPLCNASGAQDLLGGAGAIAAIRPLLEKGRSPQVREQAAGTLMNLLASHKENCRRACLDGPLLPLILDLLEVGTQVAQEYAAGLLGNLVTQGGPQAAGAAVDAGAFEALVKLLDTCECASEVYGALANLLAQLPERRAALLAAPGFVERLVGTLSEPGQVVAERVMAASLCMNLAVHAPAKSRLLKAGAVKPLVALIEMDTAEVLRERAVGALANIMDGHPETVAKVFLEFPDLARKLVYVLERDTNPVTRRHLARALALLASREASRLTVKDALAAEPLAKVLEKEQASEAVLGLLNLAPTTSDRRALLKRGIVKLLVTKLSEPESRNYAAGALANLTAGSPEAAGEATAAGAVLLLLDMLRELDDEGLAYEEGGHPHVQEVIEWVTGALGNLAEYGGASVRKTLTEGGALDPLLRVLVRASAEGTGKESAVFVLGALAEECERPVRLQLVETDGAAAALREVLDRLPDGRLRDRTLALMRLVR